MSEPLRLADQLRRAWGGDAWHGPNVRGLLRSLSAAEAAAHPVAGAHSAWELAAHLGCWHRAARRRLGGEAFEYGEGGDWPAVQDRSPEAWAALLDALDAGHAALVRDVESMRPERLDERAPGQDYSLYVLLHGVVQHDLYHAGQVALLRRGLRPS